MLDDVPVPVQAVLLVLLGVMIATTGIGFLLSYESLHRLASGHGLSGSAAWVWPSSVDSFIGIGELGTTVFLWLRHDEPRWWRRMPWPFVGITALGFTGSLTANLVEAGEDPAARLVAAVPPIAALGAFAGVAYLGHALLRRWQVHARPVTVPVPVGSGAPAESAPVPGPVALPAARPAVPVPPAVPAPVPARRAAAASAPVPARSKVVVPVPGDGHRMTAEEARAWYAAELDEGRDPPVADMMAVTGMRERWCKLRRAEVKAARQGARQD